MGQYKVSCIATITETARVDVLVEADSVGEALTKARRNEWDEEVDEYANSRQNRVIIKATRAKLIPPPNFEQTNLILGERHD